MFIKIKNNEHYVIFINQDKSKKSVMKPLFSFLSHLSGHLSSVVIFPYHLHIVFNVILAIKIAL